MKKILLDHLICPACLPDENGLILRATDVSDEDITQGELSCGICGQSFSIKDGLADLDPGRQGRGRTGSKYETPAVLSSYLWSHFGDLLGDELASDAYTQWAALVQPHDGWCLDIGAAVGRFSFEMAAKCDFVVGLDNSVAFIQTARELIQYRQKDMVLADEGRLTTTAHLEFPAEWRTDNIEFIVADAQALPFRANRFSSVTSLNMVDKLPLPIDHLRESSRVAADSGAQFLLSDPFSWSTEAAREDNWLGGLDDGPFAGHGLDNITSLLQDSQECLAPAWSIDRQGQVWWKIRTHSNHFELIRSCFVKARR
jgi:SAM-dependent methyltransferase/uncharacterized protein YbaR (Trm112 family)